MRRIVLTAAFVAAAGFGHAAEDCSDPNATQADLNQCYGRLLVTADRELNGAYRLIMHRLDGTPDAAKRMIAAQKAWIAFRDAECGFVASGMERGTAQPMVQGQCITDLTRRRTTDLKRYLNCEEGDLSCPVPKPE